MFGHAQAWRAVRCAQTALQTCLTAHLIDLCTAHDSGSNSVSRIMVAMPTCRNPIRIHSGIVCVLHHHVAIASMSTETGIDPVSCAIPSDM